MARPLRIEYPGAVYHVISRGNARQDIFRDDRDRRHFLKTLSRAVQDYNFLFHAYCLMNNHYHLLVETPDANLSVGMRQINGPYTQFFNRRHETVGHLFQGRYKAILVEKERYLMELCRYVVLNPVRGGRVQLPAEWKWSSYQATAGKTKVPDFLETDWILSFFSREDRTLAQNKYERFVLRGMEQGDALRAAMKRNTILGSSDFIERFQEALKEKTSVTEIPRKERFQARPSLENLFSTAGTRRQRNRLIRDAHVGHGYLMKEIADHLGIHYSTVSKALRVTKK